MKPISPDLRKRVVAARVEDGQSMGQIAERLRLSKATVQTILKHYGDTGSIAPKPHGGGHPAAFSGAARAALERDVLAHPDATLEQLRERSGLPVSLAAVHRNLKKLGFSLKKSRYVRASSTAKT